MVSFLPVEHARRSWVLAFSAQAWRAGSCEIRPKVTEGGKQDLGFRALRATIYRPATCPARSEGPEPTEVNDASRRGERRSAVKPETGELKSARRVLDLVTRSARIPASVLHRKNRER